MIVYLQGILFQHVQTTTNNKQVSRTEKHAQCFGLYLKKSIILYVFQILTLIELFVFYFTIPESPKKDII